MELRSITGYTAVDFVLAEGQSTEGMGIPEERKKQLLEMFPERFEVLDTADVKELSVEVTKEDGLVIEHGELKVTKTKRK